jgi:hypothetical protein
VTTFGPPSTTTISTPINPTYVPPVSKLHPDVPLAKLSFVSVRQIAVEAMSFGYSVTV